MARSWRLLLVAVGLFLLPLHGRAAESVTLAYTPILLSGLIPIAVQNGYFAEEGVEVVVKTYPSGADALQAMLAGQADLATVADIPFMFASFNEKDLRLIASLGSSDNDDKLVVKTDRGIQAAKDLRGHAVGVQTMTSFHYFLHLLLKKNGLQESDVQIIARKVNELPAAMAKGEIDAFTCREPCLSQAKEILGETIRILEEPGLYKKSSNLVARQGILDKYPNLSTKLLRALYKAEIFAYQSKPLAMAILASAMGISPATVDAQYRWVRLRLSLSQELLLILENEAEWAMAEGWNKGLPMPNFLHYLHLRAMKAVKPFGTTLLHWEAQ